MQRRCEIRVRSELDAGATVVWERVITPEGVNAELGPWMRMTVPRGFEDFGIEDVEPGERIGRSWVLLFGLIPFDYDDLTLVRVEPGRGFLERSKMLSQRLWEHERTIEPRGEGACALTDRVAWEPRLPLPAALLRPLIRATFRHRHRQLRRHFGGESAPALLSGDEDGSFT
jgi:ligand-binding SRPBCC domain-containing protein